MKIYIAGALERDTFGIEKRRREKISKTLRDLGHEILSPVDANLDIDKALKEMRPTKGSNEHSGYIRLIVENDLNLVSQADLIFVIYSRGVRKGAGTHGEITYAAGLMKPIVIWSPWHPIKWIPGWVFGCCHPKFIHKQVKQALGSVAFINKLKADLRDD